MWLYAENSGETNSNPMIAIIDPTEHYENVPPERLIEAIGILPHWVDNNDPRSAKEQFQQKYQFGCCEMPGGTVDENGVYNYPEDPPLYPFYSLERDNEMIYFYNYAMVAVVLKDEARTTYVTRMD